MLITTPVKTYTNYLLLLFIAMIATVFCHPVYSQPDFIDISDGLSFMADSGASDAKEYEADQSCTWSVSGTPDVFTIELINPVGPRSNRARLIYSPSASSRECPTDPGDPDPDAYVVTITNSMNQPETLNITGCRTPGVPPALPLDLIVAMDVSGSMGNRAVCECTGEGDECMANPNPDNESKLTYLKGKIQALFSTLQPLLRTNPDNRFGLVAFASGISDEIDLTSFDNDRLTDDVEALMDPDNGLSASGSTGMGNGLRHAINMFDNGLNRDDTRHRVIILMTNGKQNVPGPAVGRDAAGNVIIESNPPMPLNTTDIHILPVAIFTPEGPYLELLKDLGESNGGASALGFASSPYICDLSDDITTQLVGGLQDLGSPKLLAFRAGELNGENGEQVFTVTENLEKLSLNISSIGSMNYDEFSVEKINGSTVTPITDQGLIYPPLNTPSQYRVFSLDYPLDIPNANTSPGDYRVRFSANRPNLSYETALIGDDLGLKQSFFASKITPAGNKMFLGAHLIRNGDPINDAEVVARIYRPKVQLNTALAQTRVPPEFIQVKGPWGKFFGGQKLVSYPDYKVAHSNTTLTNDAVILGPIFEGGGDGGYIKSITIDHPALPEGDYMANGDKKYTVLLHETDISQAFQRELIATIPLTQEAGGIYRGIFDGTQRTGLYQVTFEAEGDINAVGPFKRIEERTPVVNFGAPDQKRSKLFLLYEKPAIISMKPVDTEGNLLGPNQIPSIDVTMSSGSTGPIVDYLDGRYVFRVSPAANEPDPKITIRINDRLLYDGLLSDLGRKRAFFSLHGGITEARNDFQDAGFDNGFFGEARLGYRFIPQAGILAKAGYYRFRNNSGADQNIIALGGGLNYRWWTNFLTGVFLQAEVGVAGYRPENGDWAGGYNGGVHILKPLGHFINLSLDGSYHYINTPVTKTEFVNWGIGLQFRF